MGKQLTQDDREYICTAYDGGVSLKDIATTLQRDVHSIASIVSQLRKRGLIKTRRCTNRSLHPLYNRWVKIVKRCLNPNDKDFKNYGGRLAKPLCDSWNPHIVGRRLAFENFRDYMESINVDGKDTVDRIDNNRGYEPGNVRWATIQEQERNRRDNIHITAFGETKIVSEWLEDTRCVVVKHVLYDRLQAGHNPEDAITTPIGQIIRKPSRRSCMVTAFNETKPLTEWMRDPRCTLKWHGGFHWRIRAGCSPEQALTAPPRQLTA